VTRGCVGKSIVVGRARLVCAGIFLVLLLCASSAQATTARSGATRATATTTAKHPTAVIILKLSGQSAPATRTEVMQQVFAVNPPDAYSVKNYWLTQTYGRVDLVGLKNPQGDVYGPYTVSSCDLNGDTQTAQTDAQNAGAPIGSYKSIIYLLPGSCGGGGSGEQPGTQVWIYGFERYTIDHELGHNFGNPHASSLRCYSDSSHTTIVTLSNFCDPPVEYGDPFDPMGAGGTYPNCQVGSDGGSIPYEMEPWRKLNIGAMTLASAPTTNVAGTHSYTIAPLEKSSGVRMLRLPDGRGDGRMFDLSFRQPIGSFDQWYDHPLDGTDDGNKNALNGVLVTMDPRLIASQTKSPLPNTYLLDMTPNTGPTPCNPNSFPTLDPGCNPCTHEALTGFEDAPLPSGQTWSDPRTGLTLTVDSVGATGAHVTITYGQGTVDVAAPSAPGKPKATVASNGTVNLSWTASTDSTDGVAHYILTRDGKRIQTKVTATHTTDRPGSGKHSYVVAAVDRSGNVGPSSVPVSVTVP
jgi:hypothetical protein